MSRELSDMDLTPLVTPNLANWKAVRASAIPTNVTDAAVDRRVLTGPGRWHFDANMLSIILGGWRIYITANNRRLRPQIRADSALWDEVSEQLRGFRLSGVVLTGSQRRVHVSSEDDTDVYGDAQSILDSVGDVSQVSKATILLPDDDSGIEVEVNFPALLAIANRSVSAADLLEVARKLFAGNDR
jgi:hypothetical protein